MPPTVRLSAFLPAFRPLSRPQNATFGAPQALTSGSSVPAYSSPFSVTANLQKRKKGGAQQDRRIQMILYHLHHPLTPRPLRFSRTRFLRHWTIHRAWLLFRRQQNRAQELELERQYNSMRAACEQLRLLDEAGNRVPEEEAGGFGLEPTKLGRRGKEVGRLYRAAMNKAGLFDKDGGVPIEYARIQNDFPSREGWNHGWTRG